jgi:hypothetical protein
MFHVSTITNGPILCILFVILQFGSAVFPLNGRSPGPSLSDRPPREIEIRISKSAPPLRNHIRPLSISELSPSRCRRQYRISRSDRSVLTSPTVELSLTVNFQASALSYV